MPETDCAKLSALVNVSIINFRTADLTIACAQSVLDDMDEIDCHITVVDNASKDGSVETLRPWCEAHSNVTFIASETNSGFSAGHNQGIEACKAQYHLVLNSDAVLKPGFLKAIISYADANPNFGLYAPRIEYEDGTRQISGFRFPSPYSEMIRGAKTGFITRMLKKHDVPLCAGPPPDQIEWASFACILLREDMLGDIGLMDEGYFLYFEDVACCWNARQKGWQVALVPEAQMVHFRGGSGPVKSLTATRKRLPAYYYASRTRVFYQMYGHFGVLAANLMWIVGRIIAHLRILAGKSTPPANQKEAFDIWTNFFSPLGKRYGAED